MYILIHVYSGIVAQCAIFTTYTEAESEREKWLKAEGGCEDVDEYNENSDNQLVIECPVNYENWKLN